MTRTGGIILSLAYIVGLLCAATPKPFFGVSAGGLILLTLGIAAALVIPRFWRTGPKFWLWLSAGIIGLLATLYFQTRVPQPAANDISRFVKPADQKALEQVVMVWGKVGSTPHLTRSQKAQFWLETTNFNEIVSPEKSPSANKPNKPAEGTQVVTGKLYVTAPLLQATGLYPGQRVAVTGVLYIPKAPTNPGAFNFQAYLAKEGSFAGLRGRQVSWPNGQTGTRWGWWVIRQRIIRSQVNWLSVPEGPLVSAMALGKQAVDLPYDIKDPFVQVGLAHTLAASGAQVSLILGMVLALTRRLSMRVQFAIGTGAIAIFVGLSGLEPSVSRAAIMGIGALVALVAERKVKPLGSLLLAATILLLFNPLWVWDLGFQFSFLATLGLVVTVPAIIKRLDWLPPAIASLIAVPLAASVWVLPLQLYIFNVISPYSILVNIITTPLISVISLGGFISAFVGFIWPTAGSALAWPLYYPSHAMIVIVEFFNKLPGNSVAVGTLTAIQLVALYGLIGLVWLMGNYQENKKKQLGKGKINLSFIFYPLSIAGRWWFAGLVAVSLVVVPAHQTKTTLFRITVLDTTKEPILVIQDRGKITLVNSGDDSTARFTVLPFLQQQGVNQIDWAIATGAQPDSRSGWNLILERVPIKILHSIKHSPDGAIARAMKAHEGFYQPLPAGRAISTGTTSVELIDPQLPVVQFQINGQNWLLLGDLNPAEQQKLLKAEKLQNLQVLWWSGKHLNASLLKTLQPAVAISSSKSVDPDTAAQLSKAKAQLYWTERDGALQWTPAGGFETMLEATENKASLL
ncbi:ComEC/Rec2 family competence protein [Microcoleus sp. FACHB-672]|uniref:ComEC/Rec2 family competence protein n=1 Tax=Microcoleus sp. FACHB-672 TaxID=2692825 RepID=UPI0016837AF5|nr:ComEC/Rec2 family competence protein [Microcoleus sp. FACHB-672]MBD2041649.1 ComEC/Rec2 family competence protein [Microcoleus sp. FACHB-672]